MQKYEVKDHGCVVTTIEADDVQIEDGHLRFFYRGGMVAAFAIWASFKKINN